VIFLVAAVSALWLGVGGCLFLRTWLENLVLGVQSMFGLAEPPSMRLARVVLSMFFLMMTAFLGAQVAAAMGVD
jgi:hypothetical protein